jgi:NAD(P)H dehydrogenase (quinone)
MRVAIVFNHPYEKSYCSAILEAVTTGLRKGKHDVDIIHLDNDNFNPVMSKGDLKSLCRPYSN